MAFQQPIGDASLNDIAFESIPELKENSPTQISTSIRSGNDLNSMHSNTHPDGRAMLQRRFTTDSSTRQSKSAQDLSNISRTGRNESLDLAPSRATNMDGTMLHEFELLKERQRQVRLQRQILDQQDRENEEELYRLAKNLELETMQSPVERLQNVMSQPTTPPEMRDMSRHGSHMKSTLATPPSYSRKETAPQQLMTPPAEDILALLPRNSAAHSVPSSRRNSDEEKESPKKNIGAIGNGRALNRNSLPPPRINETIESSTSGVLSLGQINTTGFLFDDEEKTIPKNNPTSPDVKTYLQMNATDDKFPILVRRDSYPGLLSASSAALDLALTQQANTESTNGVWPTFTQRHRPAQHSLPMNTFPFTPSSSSSPKMMPQSESSAPLRRLERSSTDLSTFGQFVENKMSPHAASAAGASHANAIPPKLQSSFSTSDLPTMRSNGYVNGRVAVDRHRRETSQEYQYQNGNVAFGPPLSASLSPMPMMTPPGISPLPSPGLYGAYGSLNLANPLFTSPYSSYYGNSRPGEVLPHGLRPLQKRHHENEANRFANVQLESLTNEIYSLCKDQHGCRFLQKKLEERNPQYVQMIFSETHPHIVELMTDPFGNYLCQKLLEYANDDQRTVLVNTAAPHLVKIALNQHGTRALQKMIEFISTPGQIQTIVNALKSKVVELIQDLNGNHVIQKCLNRLTPEDAQFIFDAVGLHCVPVGTHRHGCCVLQRCIDHASKQQRYELIRQITVHAIGLVQDPFGNYVVQYILDLGESPLSEPLIQRFYGKVCSLSKQKFSSNVIEKCIRVAEPSTKTHLIEEMLDPMELERLLRDSYANYVIQTAMDYAEPAIRQRLVDSIRPILPAIRMTPYGRRIQSKITLTSGGTPAVGHFNNPSANVHPQSRLNPGYNFAQPFFL